MFIKILTSIIEKPFAKKPYLDLVIYLESIGKKQEAEAFSDLIDLRFPHDDNAHNSSK